MSAMERVVLAFYRLITPGTRVTSTCKYVVNTGNRRRRGCILCGSTCPGWSGKHGRTKRSITWEAEHDCMVEWLAGHGIEGDRLELAIRLVDDPASEMVLRDLLLEVAP